MNRSNETERRRCSLATFLDDFIWNDRRLADSADIGITLEQQGDLGGQAHSIELISAGNEFIGLAAKGTGVLRLVASRPLEVLELNTLHMLLVLAMYATTKHSIPVRFPLGIFLKIARGSLALSVDDIAAQLRKPTRSILRWESGAPVHPAPSLSLVYRWCQALGLVCPPRTALVRVVDFSPELLRFLQEDPARMRSLTPEQFERFTAERLDRMGYNVTLTGVTTRKDGGIDLIAVPKLANLASVVIAGQMKHHRGDQKTGRDAVDRLLAWKDTYFGIGLLVTNTSFTHDAVWTAQQDRNARFLRLRDFADLKRWLECSATIRIPC